MNRKCIITLVALVACYNSFAQYLTQSAEGKSSIPLPLNGLGVEADIGKAEIAFGLNNYAKVLRSPNNKPKNNLLLGLNLSVKNTEGLGQLFSTGNINPSGDFIGFLGLSFSNNEGLTKAFKSSDFYTSLQDEYTRIYNAFRDYRSRLDQISQKLLPLIGDAARRDSFGQKISSAINSASSIVMLDSTMGNTDNKAPDLKDYWSSLDTEVSYERSTYLNNLRRIRTEADPGLQSAFKDYLKTVTPFRVTPFIFGGITARDFSLYLGANLSSLASSFKETLFRGGLFGGGINIQIKNWWIGFTYSYLDGDNFASLKSKEYTLRTVDTVGNQSLIAEKKITAYPGKYGKVETNQLSFDLVREFVMTDSSKLLANYYMRGSVHSRDTSYLKNYTNIGIGLYFIGKKSKLLGGLYVELPDINNNIEKGKPESERNIRAPFKKLTFGIVTKLSLTSLLGWANRPRTPDN